MQKKHIKLFLSIWSAFLVVAILSSIVPLLFQFVFVIRHMAYFLSVATLVVFLYYASYLGLIKKYHKQKQIIWVKIWTLITLAGALTLIVVVQNKYIEHNTLVPYQCVYLDQKGTMFYRSELTFTCVEATIHYQDTHEVIMTFHETKEGHVNYNSFENSIIGGMNEHLEGRIDVITNLHMIYDLQDRLIYYQKMIATTNTVKQYNQFYHTYHYLLFEMEQVFEDTKTISTQTTYTTPRFYEIKNEINIMEPPYESETLSLYKIDVFEIDFEASSESTVDITLLKSTRYWFQDDFDETWVVGSGTYLEEGYQLILKEIHDQDAVLNVFEMTVTQDEIVTTTNNFDIYFQETKYTKIQGMFIKSFVETRFRTDAPYKNRYLRYERSEHLSVVATSLPNRNYYYVTKESYGQKITRMTTKDSLLSSYTMMYHMPYNNIEFNYTDLLFSQWRNPVHLMHHPVFEYMSHEQP